MRHLTTLAFASTFAICASAAFGAGISPGISGSNAGLISGGGKVSTSLAADASPAAKSPAAKSAAAQSSGPLSEASKAEASKASTSKAAASTSKSGNSRAAKSSGTDSYASADVRSRPKVKAKRNAYDRAWGFQSFGYSGNARTRY